MFSAEVLSQLRSLNWLAQEIRRVPTGTVEHAHLRTQLEAVRARLPHAILAHHDSFAQHGQPSAACVAGHHCGACRKRLPAALLAELAEPGRFGVCPQCGVFLWSAESVGSAAAGPVNRDTATDLTPAVAPNTPRLET